MEHLQNYIQIKYDFTDYQMAQLRFFTVTLLSELSKFLIIGLFFIYDIRLYLWTIVVFQIVRSTTGGIHCRTYAGCLLLSLAFMVIIIKVLPLFTPVLFARILMLVICAAVSFIIGPVTSAKHLKLSNNTRFRLRLNFNWELQKQLKRRFSKHEKIILTGSKECTDGVHGIFFLDKLRSRVYTLLWRRRVS